MPNQNPLKLAKDLSLPLEAVTERIGFIGRTGQGKSYAAMLLAEQMHAAGAQFVVMDPVGIWWGLRLGKDGKSRGLSIPLLGGLRGDLPITATAGAVVADTVVDRGTSLIVDVSQFESDADRVRFATDFAKRLFFRKKAAPSALHVFLEESQEFVPQNPQGQESFMLAAWLRIAKIGRNYGFGLSFITQRPQEVNKKALNLIELLFAFQLTGSHERKAVQTWISDKDLRVDVEALLPKLEPRHPHVWSPSWLKLSRVFAIRERTTFDSSSTPKVGKQATERRLTPIDLKQLQADMAATVERAKAEDPKLLQKRIRELEAQFKSKGTSAADPKALEAAEARGYQRGQRDAAASDDAGHYYADPAIVAAKLFTFRLGAGTVTVEDIASRLQELFAVDLIRLYEVNGKRYLEMVNVFKSLRKDVTPRIWIPKPDGELQPFSESQLTEYVTDTERMRDESATDAGRDCDKNVAPTEPNPTEPNPTKPNTGTHARARAQGPGSGAFAKVTTEMLRDTVALARWREQQLGHPPTEDDLLFVVSAAEKALDQGKNAAALFVATVRDDRQAAVNQDHEERAAARLRKYRARAGPAIPAVAELTAAFTSRKDEP